MAKFSDTWDTREDLPEYYVPGAGELPGGRPYAFSLPIVLILTVPRNLTSAYAA